MGWSYAAGSGANKDRIRFMIGDILSAAPLVADEEITDALVQQPSLRLAAADLLSGLASRYARMPGTIRVGTKTVDASGIAAKFRDQAKQFRLDEQESSAGSVSGAVIAVPWAGGISRDEVTEARSDTDLPRPDFGQPWFEQTPGWPYDERLLPDGASEEA